MIFRRSLICSAILSASFSIAQSLQDPDSSVREAWYWQDQRTGGFSRLQEMSSSRDAKVRRAVFRAIAHRADSGASELIARGLYDKDATVRSMAAFAAGQRWSGNEASMLLEGLSKEREKSVRRALFDAFGRIASPQHVDTLISIFGNSRSRHLDVLTALTRVAIRGLRLPGSIWYATARIRDEDAEVRWRALYVLGRSSPHPLLATELAGKKGHFERLVDDRSADVRLQLATTLGRIDGPEARDIMVRLSDREFHRRDRDWRVLVQCVRAAGAQLRSGGEMSRILLKGLLDLDDHVTIAAAMSVPSDAFGEGEAGDRDSLRAILWRLITSSGSRAPLVSGEAMVALVRLSPSDVDQLQMYAAKSILAPRLRAKVLEALSMAPSASGWRTMAASLQESTPSVAMAAWDHLRRFLRRPGIGAVVPEIMSRDELSLLIVEEAESALRRRDMGISTVVATLMSDSSVIALIDSSGYRERTIKALSNALHAMAIPDDVEAMQALIQALGVWGRPIALSAVEPMVRCPDRSVAEIAVNVLRAAGRSDVELPEMTMGPEHIDYDWAFLRALGPRPRALIMTDRGTITIDLLPDEAPFTVLSFVRLTEAGFFNGLTFHRVVPNFVAQGGDPRGDGWGGPGYALRTEVTDRSYQRGSVGMASAGRDTEGSQFFITHLPTPHLDARYTIFALVAEGMGTADRLQVGDAIREVRIVRSRQRGTLSR